MGTSSIEWRTPALPCSLTGFAVASGAVNAQGKYPEKAVKIVVSFAAGGPTDTVARIVSVKLAELMGQTFVVRALGAGMATRARALPELPTLQEQGIPGFECYTWNAIFAPAKTSPAIVQALSQAMDKAMADPNIIKRLEDAGVDPTPGTTPEKLAQFVKREIAKWAPIIKASGAQID